MNSFYVLLLYFSNCDDKVYGLNRTCPCSLPDKEFLSTNASRIYNLCLLNYKPTNRKIRLQIFDGNINLIILKSFSQSTICDMIIAFKQMKQMFRRHCPGTCAPIPRIDIPIRWMHSVPSNATSITCSSDMSLLGGESIKSFSELLRLIFYRRLQECYEHKEWIDLQLPSMMNKNQINQLGHKRRKIFSLTIWIGSTINRKLLLLQSAVLNRQTINGHNAVIGWQATEEIYPCRNGTLRCLSEDKDTLYHQKMPNTFLGRLQIRSSGWACAQRRLLRAMAHTLLLFDPDIMIIGDDDTYINYPLIINTFKNAISSTMSTIPMIIGTMIIGTLIFYYI